MKIFSKIVPTASILLLISNLLVLNSCEKEKDTISVSNNSTNQQAVVILNNGSGFDSVLNITTNLQGVGTSIGDIGLYDFTVESNNNLNFVWYNKIPYQQGDNYSSYRLSYNMASKSFVPLPSGSKSIVPNYNPYERTVNYRYFFRQYSNFFSHCKLNEKSSGLNTSIEANFGGDLSATFTKSFDVVGEPDMGFLFPMMNSERFPGNPSYDSRKGKLSVGYIIDPKSYLFSNCSEYLFFYQFTTNPATPKVVANFMDVSLVNTGLPIPAGRKITYTFDLRSDSLFASHVIDTNDNQGGFNYQKLQPITGITVAPGLNNNSNIKKIRHYSADGKIFGMFFQDLTTKKCWTYSFDYTTHNFSKGLENASLDYSADGSDIDIDEYGNVYYSGIAGNGSNTTGVSVYRKNISGAVALVGTDNFLKFGEIIQLKYLFGKVYMAVTGRISNTYYMQLSFIKQQ